jgi:hypothetical protein
LVAALKPGDIVVLDNLGSHKGKTIRDVIRAAGARARSCDIVPWALPCRGRWTRAGTGTTSGFCTWRDVFYHSDHRLLWRLNG